VRRAFIALTAGQLVALVGAYATHVTLARLLGAADYGNYGVLLNAVSTAAMLLTAGLPEAIAKLAAERPDAALDIARRGIRMQAWQSLLLAAAYAALSPVIARLLRDPPLAPYIAASAACIPSLALIAVAQGTFNGQRRFVAQALLVAGSALARCVAVIGLGLGFRLPGAVAGLVAAPLVAATFAVPGLRPWISDGKSDAKALTEFARPVVVFTVALALLMNLDLFAVKALGLDPDSLGHYTAGATVAKMPYLALSAMGVVLLPVLSSASANNQEARELLRSSFRVLFLGSLLIAASLIPLSRSILGFLYGSAYTGASLPLALLFVSGTLFTLFFVVSYALYGVGRPRIPMVLTLVALALELVALFVLTRAFQAVGAAAASCLVAALLFAGSLWQAASSFGAIVLPKTALRASLAFAGTVTAGVFLSDGSKVSLLLAPGLSLLNLALLLISGETSVAELLRLVRRSAPAGQSDP
jgi:stage V sporulation protein B